MTHHADHLGDASMHRRTLIWAFWWLLFVGVTAAMVALRPSLAAEHIALLLLLVVLGASGAGGRMLGLTVAGAAFLAFNFFFLPPYGTLVVARRLDWLVLAAFLVTSIVAAQLLHRANQQANTARARSEEIDRLAALGAETLNAADPRDGLRAIVAVIQSILGVEECDVLGADAVRGVDDASQLYVPLLVREGIVGTLRVADSRGLQLTPARRRLLDALAFYAALGVERVRLTEAAERAEAERRLEAMRNALLTSVSHDLRTPLTSIKGIAHEIAAGGDPKAAADIEAAADRLNLLIGDMLELSRIQARAQRPEPAVETIDDLVGSALRQSRSLLRDRLVAIDSPEVMLSGRFAFTDVLRALGNLLENAAKYSPEGTPIDLRIRQDGQMVELAIMDRGPGIPDAEREKVFEPFYRSPAAQLATWGTGLGLAIARGLVEAQGGTVAYAPRDGGGAVFTLRLPAAPEGTSSP